MPFIKVYLRFSWQFQCIYKIYSFRLEILRKPLSGEMNKCSFKIFVFSYLIMTALLNTVICSKISLVGDLCLEEASHLTCRSWLASLCSTRVKLAADGQPPSAAKNIVNKL